MQTLKPNILSCLFIFGVCISCEAQTIKIDPISKKAKNETELEITKDESGKIKKIKTYKTPIDIYQKHTWEFGIGYIGSSFNAKQSISIYNNDTMGFGNGADIFINYNYYVGPRGGMYSGVGLELINISWDSPLYYATYTVSTSSSDFLYAVSVQFGGFYDIYKNGDKSLRLFGGIGVSGDFIFGGDYQRINNFTTQTNKTRSFSFPLTLGVRYNFNERHGVDLFFKYSGLTSWEFYNHNFAINNIQTVMDTNVTRNASIGVRYVYEYR